MRILIYSLVLLSVTIIVLSPVPACAQETTARVSGVVTDVNSGVLPGARVEAQQKGSVIASAISDGQGQFALQNLPSGDYTLVVSYVGFAKFETQFKATAGQTTRVNPVLNVASESESVLVTAERAHGEAEAINQELTTDNVLSVLPSEVIRSLPNANIADAVGRAAGVTLERDEGEGKYLQIRGTEPRLANLTIDGVEVPSPEGGVRQVKLDVIPADLVEMVQVNKTLEANMNGDAIGGTVNLVTRKAGDRPNVTLYGSGGFTPIIDTRKVYEFGGIAGKRFGTNKRFGLMVAGSYDYNGRGIDDVEPAPWAALCVTNCVNPDPTSTYVPDLTSVAIREYLYDRKLYGFGVSADYKLSENSNLYVHSLYSDFKDYGHRFEYVLNTNDGIPLGTGTNTPQFTTEIRNPDFQVASLSLGGNHVFGTSLLNWQFAVGRARMINPIGGGESHNVFISTLTNSNCQYLPSSTTNPYYPQFSPACFTEAYNPAQLRISDGVGSNPPGIQFSDNGLTAQLNLEGTVSYARNYRVASHASTFETGFYIRNEHKFDNSFEIDWVPNNTITADQIPGAVTNFRNSNYYGGHYPFGPGISYEAINAFLAANQSQFTNQCVPLSACFPNSNNFNLVERVVAGYIMDSIDFSRFRIKAGVRFEGTQDNTASFDPNTGGLTLRGHGSYIDVLPSVSLRMRLDSQNNSALRFVYARGLSRPDPVFLTTATSIDNSTTPATVTIGNPALIPEHGHNIDVLYERYLTPLGSIQAGFFYKRLSDPIVTLLTGPGALPQCPPTVTPCYVSEAANSGTAHIEGFEIAYQQHLGYLPGLLSGLGVSANYSYATSQANNVNPGVRIDNPALLRQAPNTWNISPTYDRGRLSLRLGLAYNEANIFSYFYAACLNGERLNSSKACQPNPPNTPPNSTPEPFGVKGPLGDVYLYSHFQVDAQGSVYLGKGLSFIASGLNLNNEVFGFYQGSTQFPIQREFYKPTYSFGFRWELGREK